SGSHLRQTAVIEHPRAPGGFQVLPDGGNAAPWLAGHDQGAYGAVGQAYSLLLGHFSQVECVGWRAEDDGGLVFQEEPQPRRTAHPAAGQTEVTQLAGGFKRRPEAQKGAKREREEQPIAGPQANDAIDGLPAVEHPLPALRRVQPAQGYAGSPRRL